MGDDHRRRGRRLAALVLLVLTLSVVPAATASKRTAAGPKGIIDALNQARAANGLPALADSRALAAAARAHAASMARRGYFAHDSADGTPFWRRIAAFYPVGGFARWQVGETLYWSRPAPSAAGVVAAWLGSPEHRDILLGDWTQVGVGVIVVPSAPGVFGGQPTVIAVADFGLRNR
jgi:uncharacterized protein YkwD